MRTGDLPRADCDGLHTELDLPDDCVCLGRRPWGRDRCDPPVEELVS